MKTIKPVRISDNAFLFCRYTIAVLLWTALLFHLPWLVLLIFLIFILSALFTVKYAPLIFLYTYTINKIIPSKEIMLDINAMRFIHTLGAVFSLICLFLLYLVPGSIGWGALFIFAVLKTISAAGYCPASKLYSCVSSKGTCCAFLKNKSC